MIKPEVESQQKSEPLAVQASASPSAERPLSDDPVRVLVADDDTDTLITLAALLQAEGFEVKMVLNGGPVLPIVECYKPDAVLLDIGMPDRSGYSLAMDLRARYGDKCPTLIALTARASESDKLQSQRSGFDYHITKPYDPTEVVKLLASIKARH